jgi:CXXX repeat modification system protein
MIIKTISLLDDEVSQIKHFNAKLVSLKNLIKEFSPGDNDFVFTKLINELSETQVDYDQWFTTMQNKYKVETSSSNSWNVDFDKKELQLLK